MERVELPSYQNKNIQTIQSIHSAFSEYEENRGDADEALDILNADLIEKSVFFHSERFSFEGLIQLHLEEVMDNEGELYGKFAIVAKNGADLKLSNFIKEYIDFLDIEYIQKLDVNNIEKFVSMLETVVSSFDIVLKNNYSLDLGQDTVIVRLERSKLHLDGDKKNKYINGRLLKMEEQSNYIKRLTKEDDSYTIYSVDGSQIILLIKDNNLYLECDLLLVDKLEKYIAELEEYVLAPYAAVFESKTKTHVQKEETSSSLFTFFGIGKKEEIIEEVKEELVENLWIGSTHIEKSPQKIVDKYLEENEETKYEWFQKFTKGSLEDLEKNGEDVRIIDIIRKFFRYASKKIKTIEIFKDTKSSTDKVEELINDAKSFVSMDLVVVLLLYRKYFPESREDILYVREKILRAYDSKNIGFSKHITIGDKRKPLESRRDRNSSDMGFLNNGNTIRIYDSTNHIWVKKLGSTSYASKNVSNWPYRRFVPDTNLVLLAGHDENQNYKYRVYDVVKQSDIYTFYFNKVEKKIFTTRADLAIIAEHLCVFGDGELRFIPFGEKTFTVCPMLHDKYTGNDAGKIIGFSQDSFTVMNIVDKVKPYTCQTKSLLGYTDSILSMNIEGELVKVIYSRYGKMKVRYYHESYFQKVHLEEISELKDTDKKIKERKELPFIKEFDIDTIDCGILLENSDKEIFWSPEGDYAIFEQNDIINILKFSKHSVNLFQVESYEDINCIFRVRFSPNRRVVCLMDDNMVYHIYLNIVENLQLDEDIQDLENLNGERDDFVRTLERIRNKQERESSEEYMEEIREEKSRMRSVLFGIAEKERAIKKNAILKLNAEQLEPDLVDEVLNNPKFDYGSLSIEELAEATILAKSRLNDTEKKLDEVEQKKELVAIGELEE